MALLTSRQKTFFLRHAVTFLPRDYTSADGSRMLLGYFTAAGLDLLNMLEEGPSRKVSEDDHRGLVDWIYRLQLPTGGFRGFSGTDLGLYYGRREEEEDDDDDDAGQRQQQSVWDPANVPGTFFALMALLALGDDLARVRRRECLEWLPKLQRPEDGSFGEWLGEAGSVQGGGDQRPCCCAAGIRYVLRGRYGIGLKGVRDINVDALVGYLRSCQSYEGGFGGGPGQEAHSGLTYATINTLWFLEKLPINPDPKVALPDVESILLEACLKWILSRQTILLVEDEEDPQGEEVIGGPNGTAEMDESQVVAGSATHDRPEDGQMDPPEAPVLDFSEEDLQFAGFSGRTNKIADTCYCFWNTGALAMLNRAHLVDVKALRRYLFEKTQHIVGGFGKGVGNRPDIMHAYLGLACLGIYGEPDLQPLDPAFAISVRARERLKSVPWWTADDALWTNKPSPNPDLQSSDPYIEISGG